MPGYSKAVGIVFVAGKAMVIMKKSTKILISVIAATLVLCVAVVAGVSIAKNRGNDGQTPTSGEDAQSTTAESTTAAPTLEQLLLGKWMDSANMSGFEFLSDGTVNVTYVNISVVNGTVKGTYTVTDNTVDIKFSIYTKTIERIYEASVIPETELTLKNKEDGKVSTYSFVKSSTTESTSSAVQAESGITGVWSNTDGSIKYAFNGDSSVEISFNKGKMNSVSSNELNGTYKGIYMTNENKLTVQFMMNETKVTQEFTYQISGNTISLTEKSGETTLLVRGGTGSSSTGTGSELVGKWSDSADMSGYNFKSDGTVDVTYVNFTVPVVNTKIDGTYSGTYSVSGGKLTVSLSIYGRAISDTFEFSVAGDTLTLKNVDSAETSTYRRVS